MSKIKEKNIENFKAIFKTEDNLSNLISFVEYIKKLIKDFKHVWTIELLNRVEIPEIFSHNFFKFILVSNEDCTTHEIIRILKFKKRKKKIRINSFHARLKFLNITEGIPVFELIASEF